MRNSVILVLILFMTGCASTAVKTHKDDHEHVQKNVSKTGREFTKHLADSRLLVTDNGLFSVEMEIPGKRFKVGVNTINLIIHEDRDRDVQGAKITFTPWMPEMGHGVFEPPIVVEEGHGSYKVENIVLVMGGHWEFRVNIKWADTVDNVVFDFPNIRAIDE